MLQPDGSVVHRRDLPRQYLPARSSRAGASKLLGLVPLALVFYAFLLIAPEASQTIGGVYLPPHRIALILLVGPAILMLLKQPDARLNFMDIGIGALSLWILVSFMVAYGLDKGIVRGAAVLIDTAVPYFLARVCIRDFVQLRYFLIILAPGLIFAGSMLALESLSGQLIVRPFFASVFGNITDFQEGRALRQIALVPEFRVGLVRAHGPFFHPILAGVTLAGCLPLYFYSGLKSWPLILGVAACIAGGFSMSSAAFLLIALSIALISVDSFKAFVPKISWWIISCFGALALLVVNLATENGIAAFLGRYTLDPQTAYFRRLIWTFAMQNVEKNPWFGLGYERWARPSFMPESIDAHFLLMAVQNGVFVPFMLLVAMFYGMVRLGLAMPWLSPPDRKLALGVNFSIFLAFVAAQTVTYWGSANVFLMALVGLLSSILTFSLRQQELGYASMARARRAMSTLRRAPN